VDLGRSATGKEVACDGTDPLCVPDGVHLDTDIDWRTVEGAEFLIIPSTAAPPPALIDIHVNPSTGNDDVNDGTRDAPFRSLRRALARWLYPGKCHPFCAEVDFSKSARVYLVEGVYGGDRNMGMELLLPRATALTIQNDPYDNDGGTYGAYVRGTNTVLSTENRLGAFILRVSGDGALTMEGLSLRNSSSPALVFPQGSNISLTTDLTMVHGRFGEWVQVGGARTPAWDTSNDLRSRDRTVNCLGSEGCQLSDARVYPLDDRYLGELSASSAPCESCGVPAPAGYDGDSGLGVYVSDGGSGCSSDGTLIAVGRGPGSGFQATFTVASGSISGVAVTDPGSGYREGSEVAIVIGSGGQSCEGYVVQPYLVITPQYISG